jgi:predicted transcriptional regulator
MKSMEVHFNPDLQAKLDKLASETGRPTRELVEDAVAGYCDELVRTREMLDSRYDDLKSGRVKPIDGEEFFEGLRRREDRYLAEARLEKRRRPLSSQQVRKELGLDD